MSARTIALPAAGAALRGESRPVATLLVLLLAALLSACASAPRKSEPASVVIQFDAGAQINPDRNGRASPAQVSVLKLKRSVTFLAADYFTLAEAQKDALDGDLVSKETFVLEPGQSVRKTYAFDDGERALGIVVGFRDMEHSRWRASADLPPPKAKSWLRMPKFLGKRQKVIEYRASLDDQAVQLAPLAPKR